MSQSHVITVNKELYKFSPSLHTEAFTRLLKIEGSKKFGVYQFIGNFMTLLTTYLLNEISTGKSNMIPFLITIGVFEMWVEYHLVRSATVKLAHDIQVEFTEDAIILYDKMSFTSKNNKPGTMFNEHLNKASWSLDAIIEWEIPAGLNLITTLLGVIYTFFRKDLMLLFFVCLCICGCLYWLFIRSLRNTYNKIDKDSRKEIQTLRAQSILRVNAFQYGECSAIDYTKFPVRILDCFAASDAVRIHVDKLIQFMNQFIIVMVLLVGTSNIWDYIKAKLRSSEPQIELKFDNIQSFMLLSMVLAQFTHAISQLMHFHTQYTHMKNDYTTFAEFWDDAEFIQPATKLALPTNLAITDVDIHNGDFRVRLAKQYDISLASGQKIVIKGKTGAGKSTFFNGILGKINGISLTSGTPENYYHHVADMFQTIREKMPSSKITLRNYFKDDSNDELIRRCLAITFEESELKCFLESLQKRSMKDTTNPTENPLDVYLNEEISGGQKTRMCLATRCYELFKFNKTILIMDEPEQGCDPEIACRVISRIFHEFRDKTIIMATHLCDCQLARLEVVWNFCAILESGIIYRAEMKDGSLRQCE